MSARAHIILIGLTGSGKTTLGGALAKMLGRPFYDIDSEIVKDSGQSVDQIFATQGESGFRRIETEILQKRCQYGVPSVIATGGGAVLDPQNVQIMRRFGTIVRILRNPESILSTLDLMGRPLLAKNPDHIHTLAREREPFYNRAADFTVLNETTLEENVEALVRLSESAKAHKRIMLIHGPNYKLSTKSLEHKAEALAMKLEIREALHENDMTEWVQEAAHTFDGILLNFEPVSQKNGICLDAAKGAQIPVLEMPSICLVGEAGSLKNQHQGVLAAMLRVLEG